MLGGASGTSWWLADGGVVQGEEASRPFGGAQLVGEVRGGLKEDGGRGSAGGPGYWRAWTAPSESRSGKMAPLCSSGL